MRHMVLTVIWCLFWGTACASEAWEAMLGLTAPVSVVSCGMCLDGGSIKGTLVDASGKYYGFFIDHAMRSGLKAGEQCSAHPDTGSVHPVRPPTGRWYVGADFNTGKAEMLEPSDRRIKAVRMVLVKWLDRVASPEEQARLRTIAMRDVPRDSCGVTSIHFSTKWFVANSGATLQ